MIGILNVHRRCLANPILLGTWFAVGLVAFLILEYYSDKNWSEAPFKVFSLFAMLTSRHTIGPQLAVAFRLVRA